MPNWCTNRFDIEGPAREIDQLLDFLTLKDRPYYVNGRSSVIDCLPFHGPLYTLLPLIEQTEQEYAISLLQSKREDTDYITRKFGSPNNDGLYVSEHSPTDISILVFSAWSPIRHVSMMLAERFPELDIDMVFDEGGVGFAGKIIVKKGELIEELSANFDNYRAFVDEHISSWVYEYQCTNPECMALFADNEDETDDLICSKCNSDIIEKE